MQIVRETPTFTATNSKGGNKYWKIGVVTDGDRYYLVQTYWADTKAGTSVVQSTEPRLVKGKNIGKANETTDCEQALFDMQSIVNKQRDKGYRQPGEEAKVLALPMLAHEFSKRGKGITYPVYVQPKLDGVRALYSNATGFYSRLGKPFIPEVVAHLGFDSKDYVFDGELMLPQPYTFQDTITAIKKFRPETSPLLQYHIYDVVEPTKKFEARLDLVNNFFIYPPEMPAGVIEVSTVEAFNSTEVEAYQALYTEQGYEGIMIRTLAGLYKVDHRSADLLKLKEFVETEYQIVNLIDSLGEPGRAIFVCKTDSDKEFNVRPRGTVEHRQALFADAPNLIGKMLTVRYQNLTDDGLPRFPVGISVRDYE